jgi:CRISPR-associated protein Csd1
MWNLRGDSMILQALTKYYEILQNDPKSGISPQGYSMANVSFALDITREGELKRIIPLFETVKLGKITRDVPRRMIVPKQVKKSRNILSNFLCENNAYVLGISNKDDEQPDYAKERHQAFKDKNINILNKADCLEAKAVIAFLNQYNPIDAKRNPIIHKHLDDIMKGGNIVFQIERKFVHENDIVRIVWEDYCDSSKSDYIGQCLITGKQAPIARLHTSLKGVKGAQSIGASIVSFNENAYESFFHKNDQGLNSPVSIYATFAYTTALNYLLSRENQNPKFTIGDTTIVYWAESDKKEYGNIFHSLFELYANEDNDIDNDNPQAVREKSAELRLREISEKIRRGQSIDINNLIEGLDGETTFYVLGLSPNASRISVRFFHRDPFEKLVSKIMQHYQDLQIVKEYDDQPSMIPIRTLEWETISKMSTNKQVPPLLGGALFRSILDNSPYPAALYYAMLNRIRADHDINYVRAAVIKAYLIRKFRNQSNQRVKEILIMALNKESTNQAYLLGRLFAVLEKAQRDAALPVKLNATIKDRYFTSACATPATTFPVLLRLSQHHISKAEYGYDSDRRIEEIMNLLDIEENPIPAHLNLDEQGIFILGYYHQRAAFFVKRNKVEEESIVSE